MLPCLSLAPSLLLQSSHMHVQPRTSPPISLEKNSPLIARLVSENIDAVEVGWQGEEEVAAIAVQAPVGVADGVEHQLALRRESDETRN